MKATSFLLAAGATWALAVAGACSSPAAPLGAGKTCEQTTDCQPGLACVPQGNQRVCTSNFSSIQHTEEGGTDSAGGGGSESGSSSGAAGSSSGGSGSSGGKGGSSSGSSSGGSSGGSSSGGSSGGSSGSSSGGSSGSSSGGSSGGSSGSSSGGQDSGGVDAPTG